MKFLNVWVSIGSDQHAKSYVSKSLSQVQEKIKNKGNFSRRKKYCWTSEHQVDCPHCTKTYSRKDDLKKHIKKFH